MAASSSSSNISFVSSSIGVVVAAPAAAVDGDVIDAGISLQRFNSQYQKLHGYASIVVCSFGIVSNVMNIVVLSRKSMASATNFMLTALAVTDMLTMLSYLPYATYFYCVATPDARYPHRRAWILYLLFNTNFTITCHTIAMWLTVSLAIFRYIVICRWRVVGNASCSIARAKVTTFVVCVTSVAFCSPNYVLYSPTPINGTAGGGGQVYYWFRVNDFVTESHQVLNYWVHGVVLKVAPCVLLAALSALLVRGMRRAERRRTRLKSQGHREESRRTAEHNRTTAMLVAVVLFFVVTELPQGLLAMLSGLDVSIFYRVYVPLGDVWDIIVLVNSAVNFVLYCIMSKQFRQTFCDVFCSRRRSRRSRSRSRSRSPRTATAGSRSSLSTRQTASGRLLYKTITDTKTTSI